MKACVRTMAMVTASMLGIVACLSADPYRMGNRALEQGAYHEAIHRYQEALSKYPSDLRARNNLGVAYLRADNQDLAFQEFQKVLAQDPADAKAHFNLGLIYYKKGLYDRELDEYRQAIALDPDHFEAHLYLGHAYLAKGREDEAIQQYQWVLDRNPDQLSTLYNLSLLYEEQGNRRGALSLLERYLKLDRRSPWSVKAQHRAETLRQQIPSSP